MAQTPPADPVVAQLGGRIEGLLAKFEALWARLHAVLPESPLRTLERIGSDVTKGVSDFLRDLTWYNAAWRDQQRWLNPIQQPAMELGFAIDRIRPASARRAGWRGQAADEYVRGVFGPKTSAGEPAAQTDAVQLIGHFGRMTNGTLGQFVGDVKNYGLALMAMLGAMIALLWALINAVTMPAGFAFWVGVAATLAGVVSAYLYYRSAHEDYVNHLRINTELLQKLAWESMFFRTSSWPNPLNEPGWPYVDQGRIKFVGSRKPQ